MRNSSAFLLAALFVLGACNTVSQRGHRIGVPKSIEVERTPQASQLLATAERGDASSVRLQVLEFNEVKLERTLHYSALEIEVRHGGNPIWEPIEWVLAPFTVGFDSLVLDRDGERMRMTMPFALLALSPFHSLLSGDARVRIAKGEPFSPRKRRRQYNLSLPIMEETLSFRVFGQARNEISSGQVKTDLYGAAVIADVAPEAVAVEISRGDLRVVVPVLGIMVEPVMPAEPTPSESGPEAGATGEESAPAAEAPASSLEESPAVEAPEPPSATPKDAELPES